MILAVFSIFFGFITKDMFIGLGSGFFSDNALFIHPSHEILLDTEFGVPTLFKLLPLLFTISLSVIAIVLSEYLSTILIYFKLSRVGYNIFSFFNQRFLIELFYNKYITGIVLKLGGQTTKVIDKGSVEYLGPYGLEKGLLNISNHIAKLNTGVITSYALYIVIGLITYLLFNSYINSTNVILLLLISLSLVLFRDDARNITRHGLFLESSTTIRSLLSTIIFNAKWTGLFYFLVLRLIKTPVSYFISFLIGNVILKFFIILLVGAVITIFWDKYVWNKFFKRSYAYTILNSYVVDDIMVLSFIVFPLINIKYITGVFASEFVFISRAEFLTMPQLSPEMRRRAVASFNDSMNLNNWRDERILYGNRRNLEIVTNALKRESNPDSEQRALIDVFEENLSPIYQARKQMEELRRHAHMLDVTLVKEMGMYRFRHDQIKRTFEEGGLGHVYNELTSNV